jgi:hypothetical protein
MAMGGLQVRAGGVESEGAKLDGQDAGWALRSHFALT